MNTSRCIVELQTELVTLVNISAEKWPLRQRTYFGSLGRAFAGAG